MNKKTYKTLEFNKILEQLSSYTQNESVKEKIAALQPSTETNAVVAMLKETTEAVGILTRRGAAPGFKITDVTKSISRVERGGVMTMREMCQLSAGLNTARRLKAYIEDDKISEETSVFAIAETITNLKNVENEINDKIINEEEMSDSASPALFAIRKKIKAQSTRIRDMLNGMISGPLAKYLQDPIITMRGDRYVIPVKAEHKGEIKGIVHDASASGSTVFIEPAGVVEMTNETAQLIAKEKEEIEKILAELSGFILEYNHEIFVNTKAVFVLDFIFCKAKLSLVQKGTEPKINKDGIIDIKRGRHPLLDKERVVPIDISLGKDYDTLVITGPNTGGKTVSLKTLGLFTLMAQSGLHIPAGENSEIAVFENVFADIGDEQSIEQSLSTFSSHIVNLVDILNQVTKDTLVLADELGAGTDPTEGAALAISIIEYMRSFGAKVAATTHYSELKMYALLTDGVENASCEFDVNTLSPTYRLMIGVPGKSNAFAISKRLGIKDVILENAKSRLDNDNIKLEDVISSLEESRKKAESDSKSAKNAFRDAKIYKENIRRELDDLEKKKAKIMQDARAEALAIIESAKSQSQEVLKEVREIKASSSYNELVKKAQKAKDALKGESDKILSGANNETVKRKPLKNVKLGETVHVVSLNADAQVLSEPDKKGNLTVQAGIMKIKTNLADLTRTESTKEEKKKSKAISAAFKIDKKTTAALETDVRGMTLDEAILVVDKFIDDAYLTGLSEVTVIHGKGTGVLRSGIAEFLRKHPTVKSYRAGRFGEGEMGVTVVTLKDK